MRDVKIGKVTIGKGHPLAVLCGPCVIESEDAALYAAQFLKNLSQRLSFPLIYKSSFDKANRSSIHTGRGPGMEAGLRILEKIKNEFDLPVMTDIHTPEQAVEVASCCDVLQIPAFLCRQTDLLVAAAKTGKAIHVKKGQFMAPWDMAPVIEKLTSTGNLNILLCDRGTSFGYNNLVSDMRGIPIMKQLGFPVSFDATHSVQLPGANGDSSGGQREFVATLAKAAIASGANALFCEAHPEPHLATSDKELQLPFSQLEGLFTILKEIYQVVNKTPMGNGGASHG